MPLENDCFAYGEYLMPLQDGLALLADRVSCQVGVTSLPLTEALGKVLAEDVVAARSVPPHNNSAVDGYAVYFDDLPDEGEVTLPVTARIAAGHPLDRDAVRGEALRIFTGAVMPDGPDTIFMEEDVTEADGKVILPAGLKRGANRRLMGEDIQEGAVILTAGQKLRPQDIGLAASVGVTALRVYQPLAVAVFSTGDEICDPCGDAPAGCVYDANRFSVITMLQALGCDVTDLGILADDRDKIRAAIGRASETHQLILTSGGVSRGEEDHVKAAVEAQGSLHFWRLAIKPGRPIAFGQVGDATFIGLPGNPVATVVTFLMIARPVILRMSGRSDISTPSFQVTASERFKKKSGRTEWQRAILTMDDQGRPSVRGYGNSGAGILTSVVGSDGLVELSEDITVIEPGETVRFIPYHGVLQ